MRPDNLLLTGMSGVGKSTIGKILAFGIGWSFVDLDAWIEEKQGVSVNTIFSQAGEAHFRKLEGEALGELGASQKHVIALGGGALTGEGRLELAKKLGHVVYLQASVESIAKRVQRSQDQRPLLKGLNPEQTRAKLAELLERRAVTYEKADLIVAVDKKRAQQVAAEIQVWLENKISRRAR